MKEPINQPTLQVKNLKTYFYTDQGIAPAVDDVSFTVGCGETLGIVGESGSGKSVTSLSVMRLLRAPVGRIVGGEILFHGKDIVKMNEKEMRAIRGNKISTIFQEPMTALNPVYTIGKQITEVYKVHQRLKGELAKAKAIEMLKMVGIPSPEQRFNEYPHQLSGGMRQRVMIAIALACNPELLVADEPTTALDVTIQAQILELMKELKNRLGTSIMLITHDLGVVSGMADKVMVLYAGQVVEYGTRDQIFSNVLHPYTTGLLNSIPRVSNTCEKLSTIEGMVPSIYAMPKGCRFNPRCPYATELCRLKQPDIYKVDSHEVRCFRYSNCWDKEGEEDA